MNRSTRGELLIWPGIGPVGISQQAIREFEGFLSSKFKAKIEFVEDIIRKDGEVDTAIRFFNDCGDGSEIIFRLFCVNSGIYPVAQMDHFDYDMDSLMYFLNN
jgi:hypothetical protein